MSTTIVGLIAEGVLLAVVMLFVVALLRSHAEILRRLGAIEDARPASAPAAPFSAGSMARDLVGETLTGDGVKLALGARSSSPVTLLAFLSSGCASCHPLWAALRAGARVPAKARLVVVTKGRDRESASRLEELAPEECELVMSTSAWIEYAVPATPHFVLVDGRSGTIAGRGSAGSWEQLVTLVEQASADAARHVDRDQSSAQRAARAEEALAGAGITSEHPSLYPSRSGPGDSGRG
ncbi:MAG: thioredoxin domain-containing protein [Solirubrobacteraceae bacterium]